MDIHLIWAQARNGVIGFQGTMPWHLPEDLAHFKALTMNQPVVMGRKTWDSLPKHFRPLPGRTNVVITRQENWHENGALTANNLPDALSICEQNNTRVTTTSNHIWIIGGAQIYAQALPFAKRVVLTEIDADFDGDTFAPKLGESWQKINTESHISSVGVRFAFVTYETNAKQPPKAKQEL